MRFPLARLGEVVALNSAEKPFETSIFLSVARPSVKVPTFVYDPPIRNQRVYLQGRAHNAVRKAIISGDLVNLRQIEVACVDCGQRAMDHEHRDYEKPLEVVPVCRGCNIRRGPAI